MEKLLAFLASLLLLEALHHAGVAGRRPVTLADLAAVLGLGGAFWACSLAFPASPDFVAPAGLLLGLHLLRTGAGPLRPDAGLLDRWRYVPAALVWTVTGQEGWAAGALVLLALRRRNFRLLLLVATRFRGPLRLSPLDADRILPPEVRYDREAGVTILEVIVAMSLLVTVSAGAFTAAAGRAGRLRLLRESAAAREAAVSEMERLGAVPFADLGARDGAEFPVAGGGEPGRVRVVEVEPGVVLVTVTAPRRGAAPVELATLRGERGDR